MEREPNAADRTLEPEYWSLISCACNGTLSVAERARLDAMLAADQGARETYAVYMLMHGELMWYFCGDAADGEETATLRLPSLADESCAPAAPADFESRLGPPGTPALFSRITIPICYAVFGLLMAIGIVAASVWAPTARPPQFVHGTGVRPSPVAGSGRMNAEKMSFDGRIDPYSHEEK